MCMKPGCLKAKLKSSNKPSKSPFRSSSSRPSTGVSKTKVIYGRKK